MKMLTAPLLLAAAALAAAPVYAASDYAKTKYPIVFSHGLFGFGEIGPVNYWHGIPSDLQANGARVFVTAQTTAGSSELRGEQLLAQIKEIQAITGASKVNLIGHSHGGQSVRYVAGVAPERVASVTAVSTANKGSPVADVVEGIAEFVGPGGASVIAGAVNAIAWLIDMGDGTAGPQDSLAAMNSLTTTGAAAFNRTFPAGVPTTACGSGDAVSNGVRYYSWSGTSHLTSVVDPSDWSMVLLGVLVPGPNDGLVPQCSSHLGTVIRDNYKMNHLDAVNQVLGLVSIFETNPKTTYRQHANRLKLAGL
ncbi:esterase/lipase family protein [Pseudomonas paralcaligenes]|uniref:esterase/lipase family protein n=1 Tax=Pseudomonas paralcaligenes TaxID=2772558 RepID=UPI001C7EF745|nr:triacylglycerol lipase [Pseudomonas paralcaligenes]